MAFEAIVDVKYKRKSSFIAEQILDQIKAGSFQPGHKLPPEREMAEQMKVSRPSVREAISALQIVGILESRPGDGVYVTRRGAASEAILKRALAVLEESDSPYDDIQVRRVVEIGAVYLAIRKGTDDDIRAIREAWEEQQRFGEQLLYREFIASSRKLHVAIARATRSKAIENLVDTLLLMVEQPLWLSMRQEYFEHDPQRIKPALKLHSDLVQAIELRQADEAVRLMERHFDALLTQNYEEE